MNIKSSFPYVQIRKLYYTIKNWDEIQENRRIYKSILPYHNIHAGQTCVIIGNGPSLRMEDLTKLHELGIKTFACNRVTLAFDQTKWRPTYYFISDQKLLAGYQDEVDGVPAAKRFFPQKFSRSINNGVFYRYLLNNFELEGKFSLDAADGIYGGGTVTVEMMQFAYYMGFQEIYLIGVDFSYATNNPLNGREYTYSGENNYFIKDYLKKGEVADMPNINANLLAFHAAKEAIEGQGRLVRNATRGGKLEVFERADLDILFEKWGKTNENSCICSYKNEQ